MNQYNVYFEGRDLPILVTARSLKEIYAKGPTATLSYYVDVSKIIAIVPHKPIDEETKQAMEAMNSLKDILNIMKEE